jgi:hypothetical protein
MVCPMCDGRCWADGTGQTPTLPIDTVISELEMMWHAFSRREYDTYPVLPKDTLLLGQVLARLWDKRGNKP